MTQLQMGGRRGKAMACFPIWLSFYGALTGLVVALTTVDWGLVGGGADLWRRAQGDAGVSLAVFKMYLNEGIGSHPLRVTSLGADGVSLLANDVFPLFAVFARAANLLLDLPAEVWMGLWLIGAFVLQGAFAALAVSAFGARHVVPCVAAAVFACTGASLLTRAGHPMLLGQFWLYAALAYVGYARGYESGGRFLRALPVLLVWAAWFTHPYLGIMSAAVVVGPLVVVARYRGWTRVVAPVGGLVALPFAAMALDPDARDLIPDLYGWKGLSAPVLGPFVPTNSDLVGGLWHVTAASHEVKMWLGLGAATVAVSGACLLFLRRGTVRFGKVLAGSVFTLVPLLAYSVTTNIRVINEVTLDVTELGARGVGVFVLVGVVSSSLVLWRSWPRWTSRERLLALSICAVATVLVLLLVADRVISGPSGGDSARLIAGVSVALGCALGSVASASFARSVLAALAVVGLVAVSLLFASGLLLEVTSTLRATGRFMWPAIAGLVVGGVVCCWRFIPRPAAAVLLIVAICIQVVDTATARNTFSEYIAPRGADDVWLVRLETELRNDDRVAISPSLGCIGSAAGFSSFFRVTIAAAWSEVAAEPAVRSRAVREECPASIPRGVPVYVVENHEVIVEELHESGYLCGGELPTLRCLP